MLVFVKLRSVRSVYVIDVCSLSGLNPFQLLQHITQTDVNECQSNACGMPPNNCTNTAGSYTCSCASPYYQLATGPTCAGM